MRIEHLDRPRNALLVQLELWISQHRKPFVAAILARDQFDFAPTHRCKQRRALRIIEHEQIKTNVGIQHET